MFLTFTVKPASSELIVMVVVYIKAVTAFPVVSLVLGVGQISNNEGRHFLL